MFLDYNLTKYTLPETSSVHAALKHIESTAGRIVLLTQDSGQIIGLLTNGDIIRWLTKDQSADLGTPASAIANRSFLALRRANPRFAEKAQEMLEKVLFVPVLDEKDRLLAVARQEAPVDGISIGSFEISKNDPCFIIAEIGNNHNGSMALAKQLVDAAVAAGADCAKFQMRNLNALYVNQGDASDASENLGSQYTLDLLSKFQLTNEELFEVFDYCKSKNILPLCTPWDLDSLAALESYGMPAYKTASADLTNHELLEAVARTGKTMISSTGMSTEQEVLETTEFLKSIGASFVLLHCNSTYPAPFKDIHLNYLHRLQEIAGGPVGYSGHERGIEVSGAAVALGAKVIERHITLDKTMEGNDHKASLLPEEFKAMVSSIRIIEESLGEGRSRNMSQGELINRSNLAKSLIINCDLAKGQVIEKGMIEIKSPGKGLQPMYLAELVGRKAKHDFKAGDFFYPNDIEDEIVTPRPYQFQLPWGIPVRYHDFGKLWPLTNLDFVEFHLSYKDLELQLSDFFDREYPIEFAVHSPELFAGDHTLDLTTADEAYRQHSIAELQRVINITRSLKKYFPKTQRPFIVVNAGGFTNTGFLNAEERQQRYRIMEDSLAQLDREGVELIPQTMPPFPWHFGGQQYHNLFVGADEIVSFCQRNDMRICLDISHSQLACSHYHWSMYEFLEKTAPYSAHLHLADAESTGGEGLQIGQGEIDFTAAASLIKALAPQAWFIPEIWQGHENNGEGFWRALEKLEGLF